MVSYKEIHWNATISNFGHFTKYSHKSLGNYFFVFIPEIKQVSYDKNDGSIFFCLIKKPDDQLFPLQAGSMIGNTEMEIRKKIYFFFLPGFALVQDKMK